MRWKNPPGPIPRTGETSNGWARFALEPDLSQRLALLKQRLDVNGFLTFLALDVMMCDWDGYAINKNNYRVYHDPDSDKIVFMPHGLDQMFGVIRAQPTMPIFPRMKGLVANAVLEIPESRKLYRQRISELLTNVFKVEVLTNRARELGARVRSGLPDNSPNAAKRYDRQVELLCQRIEQRAQSIQETTQCPRFNGPIQPSRPGQAFGLAIPRRFWPADSRRNHRRHRQETAPCQCGQSKLRRQPGSSTCAWSLGVIASKEELNARL